MLRRAAVRCGWLRLARAGCCLSSPAAAPRQLFTPAARRARKSATAPLVRVRHRPLLGAGGEGGGRAAARQQGGRPRAGQRQARCAAWACPACRPAGPCLRRACTSQLHVPSGPPLPHLPPPQIETATASGSARARAASGSAAPLRRARTSGRGSCPTYGAAFSWPSRLGLLSANLAPFATVIPVPVSAWPLFSFAVEFPPCAPFLDPILLPRAAAPPPPSRVKIVDKRAKGGKLYLKKGTVVDVKTPTGAPPPPCKLPPTPPALLPCYLMCGCPPRCAAQLGHRLLSPPPLQSATSSWTT